MEEETLKTMFSSKTDDWGTPTDFYKTLDDEFHFTFDPCPLNPTFDGLKVDWNGNIFINPPYSNVKGFLKKAHEELKKGNAKVCVFLVPSRTDTKWFHDHVYHQAELRFVKGRIRFVENGVQSKSAAPFPSVICIFRGTDER